MMLSRIAERFYWFGRYLERAENTARLLLTYSDMVLDLPLKSRVNWFQLVEITGSQQSFEQHHRSAGEMVVLRFLIEDEVNPGSIQSSLKFARENLRTIRDRVPREMVESMNDLWAYVGSESPGSVRRSAARMRFLRGLIDRCQSLRGHIRGSMCRNDAFYFLAIGRMLERTDMTTRIMDVRVDDLLPDDVENLPAFDALQWMSVLRSLSAYQMYQREMHGQVKASAVIEFLFSNEIFPRSVYYALDSARSCARHLPRNLPLVAALDELLNHIGDFKTRLLASDPSSLRAAIDEIQAEISDIDRLLSHNYFLHDAAQIQQQ